MRTTLPSLAGLRPRSDARMAFSIAADQRRIERLRDDQRRLGHRQRRDLIERHLRAVGLDVHAVEERDRRAAGAHAGHVVADVLERGASSASSLRRTAPSDR